MAASSRAVVAAVVLTAVLTACTSGASTDPPPGVAPSSPSLPSPSVSAAPAEVKVAFIQDLSSDDADGRVLPTLQGAALGFSNASLDGALPVVVDLVPLDTQGDPAQAAQVASEIADDPAYIAAIIAPYLTDQATVVTALDRAGVPTLSLSSRQPALGAAGLSGWRRLVANRALEAAALATYLHRSSAAARGICVIRGPDADDARWAHLVARSLASAPALQTVAADPQAVGSAASAIADARCGVALWAGPIATAEALRAALTALGSVKVVLAGGDELKDDRYPGAVGAAGDRTVALCPCADLSLSTDLAVQRFIQDYQAEHGLPPGPYTAEAWDAARMLVRALRAGAATRAEVLAYLDASGPFQGLANRYEFAPGGELVATSAVEHVYRDEGGRWIELTGSP